MATTTKAPGNGWAPGEMPAKFADGDRVRLFGASIRSDGDSFLIVRRDTGSTLRTNQMGAEAVRLLRKRCRIGDIKRALGEKYGYSPECVDLAPLLQSLLRGDLVQRLGKVRVPVRVPFSWSGAMGFASKKVNAKIISAAIRHAPLWIALRTAYFRRQRRDSKSLGIIRANLGRARALGLSDRQIGREARANYDLVRKSMIDRLLLAALPPRTLDRWLHTYSSISGRDHLDRAMQSGRKVVLCAFHTGSCNLIPFILAAAGYPVTVLASLGERTDADGRLQQIRDAGFDYRLKLVSGKLGMRKVARAAREGQLAMILPDTVEGLHDSAGGVEICGCRIRTTAGIMWLWHSLDAALLPVHLISDGCRHRLVVGEEIVSRGDDGQATELLYRKLESVIRENPRQWHRWKDLHRIVCEDGITS